MSDPMPKECDGFYKGFLQDYLSGCKKNPGHEQFIDVEDLNVTHLTTNYQDNDVLEFIKEASHLTVRVDVTFTSMNRPEFWSNTNKPYPYYEFRGKKTRRLGTGTVCDVKIYNEQDVSRICKCLDCQRSNRTSFVRGEITVLTALLLVYDEIEAAHSSCPLFYDRKVCTPITVSAFTKLSRDVESYKCLLTYETCDADLLKNLYKTMSHFSSISSKVHQKYKTYRDVHKLAIIVSHPHGCPKQISIGQWITKDIVNGNGDAKFTYTTCTCPGSSGATVHFIGYNVRYNSSHLHCGVTSEGNFCSIGKFDDIRESAANRNYSISPVDLRVCRNSKVLLKVNFIERHLPISYSFGDFQIDVKKKSSDKHAKTKSESRERAAIRKNYAYLVEELRNSDLVTYLFQEGILSLADKDDIDDQLTRRRKIEMVLDKVMRACPEAYPIFLRALEQEHAHVAKTLQKTDTFLFFRWMRT